MLTLQLTQTIFFLISNNLFPIRTKEIEIYVSKLATKSGWVLLIETSNVMWPPRIFYASTAIPNDRRSPGWFTYCPPVGNHSYFLVNYTHRKWCNLETGSSGWEVRLLKIRTCCVSLEQRFFFTDRKWCHVQTGISKRVGRKWRGGSGGTGRRGNKILLLLILDNPPIMSVLFIHCQVILMSFLSLVNVAI